MAEQQPFGQPPKPNNSHPITLGGQHHQKNEPDERFVSFSRQVADLLSRLRLMEERYANLRREHQITGQNMIEHHQTFSKQQRKLTENSLNLKRNIHELQEQITNMQGELADVAKVHDLKVIERYLDFWNPLDFITREEADKIIQEALQESASRKFYKPESGEKEEDGNKPTTNTTS